VKNVQRNCY